jgi:hypothetical protein
MLEDDRHELRDEVGIHFSFFDCLGYDLKPAFRLHEDSIEKTYIEIV